MTFYVRGLGTALPELSVTQGRAAELCAELGALTPREARIMAALYRRTGIERRSSVLLRKSASGVESLWAGTYDATHGPSTSERMREFAEHAPPLACAAANAALVDADVDPKQITHLVTVSCTGFIAPGIDTSLIERLGLRRTTRRVNVGFMGCHGALNGLDVATGFVAADARHCVLLCAVELPTLHLRYGLHADSIVPNGIFADGAAALVGSRTPRDHGAAWCAQAFGSYLLAESRTAMTWSIGDRGFAMTLAPNVPDLIQRQLRPWLEAWLLECGLKFADVQSWGVHPGGPRILDAVQTALELPAGCLAISRRVLAEHGNMSSPTILFILKRMMTADQSRPCVLLGFGPGLIAEAALLT